MIRSDRPTSAGQKKSRVRRPGSYLILPPRWRNHLPEGNSWSHITSLGGGSDEADQQPVAYMQCTSRLFKKQSCNADMQSARILGEAMHPCYAVAGKASVFRAQCPKIYHDFPNRSFPQRQVFIWTHAAMAQVAAAGSRGMRQCSESARNGAPGQNVQRSALDSRKSRKAVMRAVFFSSEG